MAGSECMWRTDITQPADQKLVVFESLDGLEIDRERADSHDDFGVL